MQEDDDDNEDLLKGSIGANDPLSAGFHAEFRDESDDGFGELDNTQSYALPGERQVANV